MEEPVPAATARLLIDVLSVTNAKNDDATWGILDGVQYPILSLVQSESFTRRNLGITIALELLAIVGTRILAQFQYSAYDLAERLCIERLEVVDGSSVESQIIAHPRAAKTARSFGGRAASPARPPSESPRHHGS